MVLTEAVVVGVVEAEDLAAVEEVDLVVTEAAVVAEDSEEDEGETEEAETGEVIWADKTDDQSHTSSEDCDSCIAFLHKTLLCNLVSFNSIVFNVFIIF